DSGLSNSEESVFSGLEDSGSDNDSEDGANSDEGHVGTGRTIEKQSQAGTPSPRTEATDDEYAEDSSDEEDIRTVGNVPLEWYADFPHVGYDLDGRRIYKPLRTRDELDQFLDKMDDPNYWRTVQDRATGREVQLTDEQVALVRRLQRGQFGDVSFDPYEPAVDFSADLMIHPVTNRPADKRSFIPSLVEKEKVSRMVHAIKMGWIQPRRPRDPAPSYYDLWAQEDPNAVLGRHKMHVPAPKLALPGHAESYNPPPEYLPSEEERLAWERQEPGEGKLDFLPHKFPSLRAVPAYSRFIQERFERCLDLYLCPRQRKMRVNVDPEDSPQLPRPRDLQPFPTCQALVYRGHSDLVRCLSVSPGGQWLASGSDDGSVRLWEVASARCMKTVPVGAVVKSITWNPNPAVCLVAVAVEDAVLLLNPALGDRLVADGTDQLLSAFCPPEEPALQPAQWLEAAEEERQGGLRLRICHGKPSDTGGLGHGRGDYLAVVLATQGRRVLIHQLSPAPASPEPFSARSHGQGCRRVALPPPPRAFPAAQASASTHLLRQELTKKLMPNCKWVSSLAVHPAGDNIICGSYDSKLVWFDLDLSTRPYKVLRHHKKALRAVAFHPRYPLFASGSDDGSVIVCHGMVYNDLLQNPLLVPVKVLKGHVLTRGLGVLDVAFHPTQPWLFSSGADGTLRLFT
uniref:Ribosome biogenesis protein BOP1 n=1 Tax=Loxodonta africana TaxID=9785 RepID=G3UGV3_LOXAF